MKKKKISKNEIKEKESLDNFKKEQEEVTKYLQDKLGMPKIDYFIILAVGENNDKTKCWNWRINGPFEFIITLLEEFKLNLLTGRLISSKVTKQAEVTLGDLNKKDE